MLRPRSLGMVMSNLHFLYLARPYAWNVSNICFTFPLCMIALYIMHVYLYMSIYGWSCTLYDGLLWLRERPSLVTSALDLIVWICAQGNCCRCIFMLYCMRDHRNVIVSIHVTWVILVSTCMRHASMCLMLWGAPARLSTSMLACAINTSMKPCRCTIAHQMRNSVEFSPWKLGTSVAVFSQQKIGKNNVLFSRCT